MVAPTASRTVTVTSPVGLHARPAAVFVRAAAASGLEVTVAKGGGEPVDARSILAVLGLDVRHGDRIDIRVTGDDAERVVEELAGIATAAEPAPE